MASVCPSSSFSFSVSYPAPLPPPPPTPPQSTLEEALNQIEQKLVGPELQLHQDVTRRSENAEKRGQAYELVGLLQNRLTLMEQSLAALADDFNSSRGGSYDKAVIGGSRENSVAQTVEILNHQFEQLAQLDEKRRSLHEKVAGVVPSLRSLSSRRY